jgi:hypothetical protein
MKAYYDSTNLTSNVVLVSVNRLSGDDDYVDVTVDGVPDYMTASISPERGIPPFGCSITFKLGYNAERNVNCWKPYTVMVKARSTGGRVDSMPVTFTYYPENAAEAFDGKTFWLHEACSAAGNDTRMVLFSGFNGQITMQNFYLTMYEAFEVPISFNARNRTVTVGPYTQSYYTFVGSGTFFGKGGDSVGITLHYSRTRFSTYDTCTADMWYD